MEAEEPVFAEYSLYNGEIRCSTGAAAKTVSASLCKLCFLFSRKRVEVEAGLLGGTSHGNKGGRRRPSLPPPPLQRPTLLLFPLPSRSLERKICITQFFRQFFSSSSPLFFFSRGPFFHFFPWDTECWAFLFLVQCLRSRVTGREKRGQPKERSFDQRRRKW